MCGGGTQAFFRLMPTFLCIQSTRGSSLAKKQTGPSLLSGSSHNVAAAQSTFFFFSPRLGITEEKRKRGNNCAGSFWWGFKEVNCCQIERSTRCILALVSINCWDALVLVWARLGVLGGLRGSDRGSPLSLDFSGRPSPSLPPPFLIGRIDLEGNWNEDARPPKGSTMARRSVFFFFFCICPQGRQMLALPTNVHIWIGVVGTQWRRRQKGWNFFFEGALGARCIVAAGKKWFLQSGPLCHSIISSDQLIIPWSIWQFSHLAR